MSDTYCASRESIKIPEQRAAEMPPVPINVKSPVLEFHDMHWKIQADLNGWMTIDQAARKAKTEWYANLLKPRADKKAEERRKEDVVAYRMREDYQHRILLAIYSMESAHPLGSRDVAVVVTNALFPKTKE